jgi:glucose-6-phosphate dehydrogenase assembly protein OpcA
MPLADRRYPAFRAWLVRLLGYGALAMVLIAVVMVWLVGQIPDGMHWLPVSAAALPAGWLLGAVAMYVVTTALHDREQAARRELEELARQLERGDHG